MQTASETLGYDPTPEAQQFADTMFAIHTRFVEESDGPDFFDVVMNKEIPRPQNIYNDTEQVARDFGFPKDAVYWFLGRAFWRGPKREPNVAVAVPVSHLAATSNGTVTSCDTGLLRHNGTDTPGFENVEMKLHIGMKSVSDRAAYSQDNRQNVQNCASYFASHVTRYFNSPENYWKKPDQPIDSVDLEKDDWRDWTFEMQLDPPVDCTDGRTMLFLEETDRSAPLSTRGEGDRLLQSGLESGIKYGPVSNVRTESAAWVHREVLKSLKTP